MEFDWAYIVPALLLGTMGWMLYWFGLPTMGAVAGGGTGATLGMFAATQVTAAWTGVVFPVLGFLMGAVLGFVLVRTFQIYLFFAAGASIGGMLGFQVVAMPAVQRLLDNPGPWATFLVVGTLAVIGGLICLRMRRYIVAVITSVLADFLLVMGLPDDWKAPGMIIGLAVFLAIQIGLVRRFVGQEEFDRRTRYRMRDEVPDVRTVD